MNDLVLMLDCDGLLVNSLPMIEELMIQINYVGSNTFSKEVTRKHHEKEDMLLKKYYENDHEIFDKKMEEERKIFERNIAINRITKDEVLEELKEEYKNSINYRKIYRKENLFPGVIDVIQFLYKKNIFKKIYIVTHFNTVNEVYAKHLLFKEVFPFIEVVYVPYHDKGRSDMQYIEDKTRYFEYR